MAIGLLGSAATMASAVAVFPAPGRAETTTFWVRHSSTMACCSGEGMDFSLEDVLFSVTIVQAERRTKDVRGLCL